MFAYVWYLDDLCSVGSMAELDLGSSLSGGVGSNPTAAITLKFWSNTKASLALCILLVWMELRN